MTGEEQYPQQTHRKHRPAAGAGREPKAAEPVGCGNSAHHPGRRRSARTPKRIKLRGNGNSADMHRPTQNFSWGVWAKEPKSSRNDAFRGIAGLDLITGSRQPAIPGHPPVWSAELSGRRTRPREAVGPATGRKPAHRVRPVVPRTTRDPSAWPLDRRRALRCRPRGPRRAGGRRKGSTTTVWKRVRRTVVGRSAVRVRKAPPDGHVPGGYRKTDLDFRRYEDRWLDAVRRARALAPRGKEQEVNPSTGMWRLALAVGSPD